MNSTVISKHLRSKRPAKLISLEQLNFYISQVFFPSEFEGFLAMQHNLSLFGFARSRHGERVLVNIDFREIESMSQLEAVQLAIEKINSARK